MNKKIIIGFLILVVSAVPGFCADSSGTTGLQFLKMGVGARSAGLGEAFTAVSDDIYAISYNPSGLMGISGRQATFMYNMWIENINAGYLAYAQPIGSDLTDKAAVVGVAVNYVGYGTIPKTGENAEDLGTYSAQDYCVSIGGASTLMGLIDLGVTAKLISSTIENYSAFGVVMDIGAMYMIGDMNIGIVGQNLGSGITYVSENTALPSAFKLGLGYKILKTKPNSLLAFLDVNMPNDNVTSVNVGAEYGFNDLFSVRVGYKGAEPAGITFGAGVKINKFLLIDYAFVPCTEMWQTHRISLTALF